MLAEEEKEEKEEEDVGVAYHGVTLIPNFAQISQLAEL